MAKSIKFKNNTYIDSSGVMHNRTPLNQVLNNIPTPTELTITQIRNDTSFSGTTKTYQNGCDGYKFYILLSKVASSNAGYSTAVIPASLVTSSGFQVCVADEATFVRAELKSSGKNLLYTDKARTNTGYIQYIYGVK